MNNYEFAKQIRLLSLKAVYKAGCGHIGSSLSCADIIAVLYNETMNIFPKDPQNKARDRFVLSKGHACPALYAALAMKGFFAVEELEKLRKTNSFLEGMPSMTSTPGIDMSSGSLGQGISAAAGMALASRLNKQPYNVYAISGDGELNEGQVWESLMFAAHHKLSNLCIFIDNNGLQLSGKTDEIFNTAPLPDKLNAFGAKAIQIDGNDLKQITEAIEEFEKETERPTVIIAHTVKGKGVSFMENKKEWHGKAPNKTEYDIAVAEVSQ